jgi:DNA polymerase V
MRTTDVSSVWGIGRKISEKLKESGVHSVLDLFRADASTIPQLFSGVLEKT